MKTKKKTNKVTKVVDMSGLVKKYFKTEETNVPIQVGTIEGRVSNMTLGDIPFMVGESPLDPDLGNWTSFVGSSIKGTVGDLMVSNKVMLPEEMLAFFNWAKTKYGLEFDGVADSVVLTPGIVEKITEYRKWKSERMLRPIVE